MMLQPQFNDRVALSSCNRRYKRLQAADDEHAQKRLELDKSNPEYKWECQKYQDMFSKEGITFTEEHRARYKCY
jgi:hypothetical protein